MDAISHFYTPAAPNSPHYTHVHLLLVRHHSVCHIVSSLWHHQATHNPEYCQGHTCPGQHSHYQTPASHSGTGASIPGPWGQSMQQSTNFADPRLLDPMSTEHSCLLLLMGAVTNPPQHTLCPHPWVNPGPTWASTLLSSCGTTRQL